MSPERFDHLLALVGPKIAKKDTSFRKSISAAERLALTLRFLATGDAQQSLSYSFRIGKATVSKIISETCDAIYTSLAENYLSPPTTQSDWLNIAEQFEELWNMPHVIGCIDGKHIRIECPKLTGTLFHNYKGFFSIVLLAICDANFTKCRFYDAGSVYSIPTRRLLLKIIISKLSHELEIKKFCFQAHELTRVNMR